ncbi:hypothetical protein OH492_13245 [Vibrio chagasii]|nr:hypothetical protein [Vibrio chagasii]
MRKNMKQHGGGAIVNIGSMWQHQATGEANASSAYLCRKRLHALRQKKLRCLNPGDHGVRVKRCQFVKFYVARQSLISHSSLKMIESGN